MKRHNILMAYSEEENKWGHDDKLSEAFEGELSWVCGVVEHSQPGAQRYLEGNQFLGDTYHDMNHIGISSWLFAKQNLLSEDSGDSTYIHKP